MIDLSKSSAASPQVHTVDADPSTLWSKDVAVAINASPDSDTSPHPEATWPSEARRTGVCGVVSPRVLALPGGGYRMYYSQMRPRPGHPAGANDYDNASTRILSAYSQDGNVWVPEPGVRLSPQKGGAGDFRVVSSEVVPVGDGRQLQMYFECCAGSQAVTNSIRSATSSDGLNWKKDSEPVIAPGPGGWDAAKSSEMCLIRIPGTALRPPAIACSTRRAMEPRPTLAGCGGSRRPPVCPDDTCRLKCSRQIPNIGTNEGLTMDMSFTNSRASIASARHTDTDWASLSVEQRIRSIELGGGYVVIPDLLPAGQLDAIRGELSRLPTTAVDYSEYQRGCPNVQWSDSPTAIRVIALPAMIEFLTTLFCDELICTACAYAVSQPGHPGIAIHTDAQPYGSKT